MARRYLDHAATTPMLPEAVAAVTAELTRVGNASSTHGSGRAARRVVEESRELVASQVGAEPAEVIFTSGGTESDNLAVLGAYRAQRQARGDDPPRTPRNGTVPGRRRVVLSAIEHHAVHDAAGWLGRHEGAEAVEVGVDGVGRLDLGRLDTALTTDTAVVSVIWASNEVGTCQPVREVAALAAERGAVSHSDAVQALGHVPVDFAAAGLDLLTVTAHKLGGPYGVGALLARRGVPLAPMLHGGGQERDVRSGTLDVAAIAGFAAAVDVAVGQREAEERRLRALRADLVAAVRAVVPDVVLHGTLDPDLSLPGLTNLGFPGCPSDALLMLLDAAGIDCSAGSACAAGVARPSHVLLALGCSEADARSAVRFSLGHTSTPADVAAVAAALPDVVARARAAATFA